MGGRYYLVLKSTQGHTTLCKGHVEGNETEHETAIREIREETGLTLTSYRSADRDLLL